MSQKEDKLTFFVSAEELQLFLLLPPQCVDYSDGQPERLLRVTVWSQGVHSGARSRDVLCGRRDRKKKSYFNALPLFFHMNVSSLWTTWSPLSHRATGATLGRRRGSCRGCHGNSSWWCSGPLWWCAAGGGPASAGRRPRLLAWTPSGEAESVNLRETNTSVLKTHINKLRGGRRGVEREAKILHEVKETGACWES